MKKYVSTCVYLLLIFTFTCLFPFYVFAQINLWSFGTNIEPTDGDIEFYQTWYDQSWYNLNSDFYLHDITYSSDGLHVKGWILEPKTIGPHPVLIWNRGGVGSQGDIKWTTNGVSALYSKELWPYASAGYVVVCTQYRGNGFIVSDPISDYVKGTDPFIPGQDNDNLGGNDINDVINLLPLIQKLNKSGGNGGLAINVDQLRIGMMGMSRGGMETYMVSRELSNELKYGELPKIKATIVKGAVSHFPDLQKDEFNGYTALPAGPYSSRIYAAIMAGNSNWTYPDDFDDPGDPYYNFWSFFPDFPDPVIDNFPAWDDNDLLNDEWPESGIENPPSYPYSQIYSEEWYARSAVLWDDFWSKNTTPLLILHGRGDTQVLVNDAEDIYNKMVAVGDSSLYRLELFDDSNDNCDACSFLGNATVRHCDHWLVEYDYGRNYVMSFFETHLGIRISIDIKPGSDQNCINSDGHGAIPVAILSNADFDATQVDPATVSLDGQAIRVVGKGNTQAHIEDINGDGFDDLIAQIEDTDGTYLPGDTAATLTAKTFDGISIIGTDTLCIVP